MARLAGLAGCVAALAAVGGWGGGCSTPWAATTNRYEADEEPAQRAVLDRGQRRELTAAMGSVAHGAVIKDRPSAARHGVRWSDVSAAAAIAAGECEMAVVSSARHADGVSIRFALKTINDRPGELIVRPAPEPRVYEAAATIGRFVDDTAAATRLLEAFDRAMRALGRHRRMPE